MIGVGVHGINENILTGGNSLAFYNKYNERGSRNYTLVKSWNAVMYAKYKLLDIYVG